MKKLLNKLLRKHAFAQLLNCFKHSLDSVNASMPRGVCVLLPAKLKPMLAPCEQIALLKEKGVAFNRCDEEAAIEALFQKGTYLHIASYRRLFQKHESGPQKGKYVNLDFADLLYLDELDSDVRRAFLLASQDVERLAKTALE